MFHFPKIPISFFGSLSYLTGVTTAELWWHQSNIWKWYSIGNQCFDNGEKFGKWQNSGNCFSDPHHRGLNKTYRRPTYKSLQIIQALHMVTEGYTSCLAVTGDIKSCQCDSLWCLMWQLSSYTDYLAVIGGCLCDSHRYFLYWWTSHSDCLDVIGGTRGCPCDYQCPCNDQLVILTAWLSMGTLEVVNVTINAPCDE